MKTLEVFSDGSFNQKENLTGSSCVILNNEKEPILFLLQSSSDKVITNMHQIGGEIQGALNGIKYAIENGFNKIVIYYDYAGVELWANGVWKTNKPATKLYKAKVAELRNSIEVDFIKVKGHVRGEVLNNLADKLAKFSCNVIPLPDNVEVSKLRFLD